MAERRMFAKTIIDSDAFLDMPLTTQALYFHLSMRADDEGFINNPKKIQRMIGATEDDLKLLIAKNFIIPFESGIVVIKHWRIHNYIRGDRLKSTMYAEERDQLEVKENGAYTLEAADRPTLDSHLTDTCQTFDGQLTDNRPADGSIGKVRLGKDRLGEVREGKGRLGNGEDEPEEPEQPTTVNQQFEVDYKYIICRYNEICKSLPKVTKLTENRKKAIKARLRVYSYDEIVQAFETAEQSEFLKGGNDRNWNADFDWIMTDRNLPRILEGKYNSKFEKPAVQQSRKNTNLDAQYMMMAQWAQEEQNNGIED